MLPTALNDIADDVVDMNGATSPVVTWEYAVEEEDAPLLIFIAVAVGFVAVALFIAAQRRPEEKSYTTQNEIYETVDSADVEEDEGEAAQPETESTEATDDDEEAPTKSIYDLQPDDE